MSDLSFLCISFTYSSETMKSNKLGQLLYFLFNKKHFSLAKYCYSIVSQLESHQLLVSDLQPDRTTLKILYFQEHNRKKTTSFFTFFTVNDSLTVWVCCYCFYYFFFYLKRHKYGLRRQMTKIFKSVDQIMSSKKLSVYAIISLYGKAVKVVCCKINCRFQYLS